MLRRRTAGLYARRVHPRRQRRGLVGDVTVGDCTELLELARQVRGEGRAGRPFFCHLLREAGVVGQQMTVVTIGPTLCEF
jgi:hypothetical protein